MFHKGAVSFVDRHVLNAASTLSLILSHTSVFLVNLEISFMQLINLVQLLVPMDFKGTQQPELATKSVLRQLQLVRRIKILILHHLHLVKFET